MKELQIRSTILTKFAPALFLLAFCGPVRAQAPGVASSVPSPFVPGPAPAISAGSAISTGGTIQRGALPVDFLNASGMEFRLIEPGAFMMGTDATVEELTAKYPGGQANSFASSTRRRVTLTQRFYLSKKLTTVADFRRFVEATGYKTTAEQKGEGRGLDANGAWASIPGLNWQEPGFEQTSKHPVVCVSFYDALAYVNWLNATAAAEPELGGKPKYALPTEAQWEYAARAGKTNEFFWGDEAADGVKYLNAADASGGEHGYKWSYAFPFNDGFAATSPVASFEPNAWGLYDMLGNVWEWCSDRFGNYSSAPAVDPQGAALGEYRSLRGGGWDAAPALARCAYRGANLPNACNTNYGFRVALIPPAPEIAQAPLIQERLEEPTRAQEIADVPEPVEETAFASSGANVEENDAQTLNANEDNTQEEQEKKAEASELDSNPLKKRIAQLGLGVLEGQKLIGDESVGRALDMIETSDYRKASKALKAGLPLEETLRKKIKMVALLSSLGTMNGRDLPNYDLLPSVAQDRVMLLGSLAFLGLELLKDDENANEESPEKNENSSEESGAEENDAASVNASNAPSAKK